MELQKRYLHRNIADRFSVPIGILASVGLLLGNSSCGDADSGIRDMDVSDSGGITVGSFNAKGAHHTAGLRDGWRSGEDRMEDAYELIDLHDIELLGFQELEPEQRREFLKQARFNDTDWGIHPNTPIYGKGTGFKSPNSIVWREDVFELVSSGYHHNIDYLGESNLDAPWVLLRHIETGTLIYIKNTHDPANVNGPEQKDRTKNAHAHVEDIGKLASSGLVEYYILTGDLNSKENTDRPGDAGVDRETELPYCILTEKVFINTFDSAKGIADKGPCPTKKDPDFGIDHVYTSPNFITNKWVRINETKERKISDHPLVFADIYPVGINEDDASALPLFSEEDSSFEGVPVNGYQPDFATVEDVYARSEEDGGTLGTQVNYDTAA